MIAYNSGFASLFQDSTEFECFLLEEEEIYTRRKESFEAAPVVDIRFGDYQQSEGFLQAALDWHDEVGFDAVVAGLEYAVPAAELFATTVGLRSVGPVAADACTHKDRLRLRCQTIPIHQPRFAAVRSARDVQDFFRGDPMILKPANRQASVGVVRIDRLEQIEDAWRECTSADEGTRTVTRPLQWDFIVEEFIDGQQISVESLVADGCQVFHNPTLASTFGGNSFAEVGHVVPAPLPANIRDELLSAVTALLDGLAARDGVFHSEWKLTDRGPVLIECAARAPGDLLPQLIEKAYGFDLYEALVRILLGEPVRPPQQAERVAGVQFFRPPPGTFVQLNGLDSLVASEAVFDFFVNMQPGDPVPSLRNSWSRAGYYAFSCADYDEHARVQATLNSSLEFVVSAPVG